MGTDLRPCLNAQGQWRRGPFSPRAVSWKVTGCRCLHRSNRWGFVFFPGPRESPLVTVSGGSLRPVGLVRGEMKGQCYKNCLLGPEEASGSSSSFETSRTF